MGVLMSCSSCLTASARGLRGSWEGSMGPAERGVLSCGSAGLSTVVGEGMAVLVDCCCWGWTGWDREGGTEVRRVTELHDGDLEVVKASRGERTSRVGG